jgi:hypothetical protein
MPGRYLRSKAATAVFVALSVHGKGARPYLASSRSHRVHAVLSAKV